MDLPPGIDTPFGRALGTIVSSFGDQSWHYDLTGPMTNQLPPYTLRQIVTAQVYRERPIAYADYLGSAIDELDRFSPILLPHSPVDPQLHDQIKRRIWPTWSENEALRTKARELLAAVQHAAFLSEIAFMCAVVRGKFEGEPSVPEALVAEAGCEITPATCKEHFEIARQLCQGILETLVQALCLDIETMSGGKTLPLVLSILGPDDLVTRFRLRQITHRTIMAFMLRAAPEQEARKQASGLFLVTSH